MFKDYYKILKIIPSVTEQEIKTAYIKQCLIHHPDKNLNKDTTGQMQEINEAYLVLKDNEARLRYNQVYLEFKKSQELNNSFQENEYKDSTSCEYNYEFSDDILKKWMTNAKTQAQKIKYETIDEIKGSSSESVKSILSILLPILLMFFLLRSCNT